MKSLIKIFLLSSFAVFLQGCADSYEILALAYDYYEEEKLNETLEELRSIKSSTRKNGLLYKEICLFEGRVYFELDSLDQAERSFQDVLSESSKAIQLTRVLKNKIASVDPYSKLYYDANMNLARIYTNRGQYQESLRLLQQAAEGSDYFGCLFGKLDEEFWRDSLFVRNQLELGRIGPIFERLGGTIFNLSKNRNYRSIDELVRLIQKSYTPDEIAIFLKQVLTSIERREILLDGSVEEAYFSNWFGYEVRILGLNRYNYLNGYYYDYEIEIDSITGIPSSIPKTEEQLIEIVQAKILESEIYLALQG